MPNELFLTTRQTIKIRNAFADNISIDAKLSKAQIFKIIQSCGSFGSWFGNLGKKALKNIAVPLARDNLPGLVSNLTLIINKCEKKKLEKKLSEQEKIILFISNENMNDITKIIKSLEDSGVLIDGVTETVKHEIKKQEGKFLGPLAVSLVHLVISLVVKGISRREVRRAGRGYGNKHI